MFKKFIANTLTLSIILSNTFLTHSNSIASTQLSTRYENIQGDSLSIDNLVKGMESSFEIEGNTMINVFDYSKIPSLTSTPNNLGFSINNKEITRDYTVALGDSTNSSLDSTENIIKNGEIYTFVLDVTKNTVDNTVEIFPHISVFSEWYKGSPKINQGYLGKVILSFKAKTDYNIKLLYRHFDHTKTGSISISNIMLLKGDYYDKFTSGNYIIPQYFEGAKSVGEDINTLEIKSENKNLFDINNLEAMNYSYKLPYKQNDYNDIFTIDNDTINYSLNSNRWNIGVGGVYKVKKNTFYTVKYDEASCNRNYTMNINIIGLYEHELNVQYWASTLYQNYSSRVKFVTNSPDVQNVSLTYDSEDYDYLAIYIGGSWKSDPTESRQITLKNVGIYETNDSNIEYKRYEYNNVLVKLLEPLKAIPGVAKDVIVRKNGKWYIERNVGCATIDGTEDWSLMISDIGIRFFEESNGLNKKHYHKISSKYLLSDKLTNRNIYLGMLQDEYTDYIITTNLFLANQWRIITTQDMSLSEFKSWLATNKPKVYYELETPVYELIDTDLSIYLYEHMSYVTTSSTIPANIKIAVDRILNRVVESIKVGKDNPTISNIEQARMWVNLMEESIDKDFFQDDINSITQVKDLEIEKKKASANLDLYIRIKNTVSLSLDTNCIVFEDFDSTEDLELLNAININVSSSLPYSLNAYLEDGLYNADRSSSLGINTLNIKENTDNVYKQFTSIKEKLILKDNCSEGNEKYHIIDLKLSGGYSYKTDIYKTIIKFEVEQK